MNIIRVRNHSELSRPATSQSILRSTNLTRVSLNSTNRRQDSASRAGDRTAPIVTSKSWSVYNLKRGSLLYSKAGQESREIASLTKIMTALTAVSLSEHFNLDLSNTFTEISTYAHMVGTIGTNADLRKGDQISLENLFYGLLIPSGNDAAIAMAQYFGGLLMKSRSGNVARDTYSAGPAGGAYHFLNDSRIKLFIKAMNKMSKRFCLKNTFFNNPHGLSDKGNKSTSEDIGRLACVFMQSDYLRKISNTKKYTASVTDKAGVAREIIWRNTNKMLDISGYSGIKTGSTPNAGPCLCAVYTQDNIALVITVLGANSSEHRWSETDRLAKWVAANLQEKKEKFLYSY